MRFGSFGRVVLGAVLAAVAGGCDPGTAPTPKPARPTPRVVPVASESPAKGAPEVPGAPPAADLLKRMGDVYSQARSYRDRGIEVKYMAVGGPQHPAQAVEQFEFTSRIVPPDRFRIDVSDAALSGKSGVYWNSGAPQGRAFHRLAAGEKTDTRPLETLFPTELTLASLAPRLLIPSLTSPKAKSLTEMAESGVVARESLDGHDCWVVGGVFQNLPVWVWIDVDSALVRRFAKTLPGPATVAIPGLGDRKMNAVALVVTLEPDREGIIPPEELARPEED